MTETDIDRVLRGLRDDFRLEFESACELRPMTAREALNSLMDEGLSMLADRPRLTFLSALAGVLNEDSGDESAAVPAGRDVRELERSTTFFDPGTQLPRRAPCNACCVGGSLGGDDVEAPQPITPHPT